MNTIYCFSGTGNGLKAAMEISKSLGSTKLISMHCNPQEVSAAESDLIGFIFPVYHWTMPDFAKHFIEQVKINPNAYIFGIASCGGLYINALYDLSQLIKAKGATLSYAKSHNNVASYVAEYEPFPNASKQLPKSEYNLKKIIEDINDRICTEKHRKTLPKELMRLIGNHFIKDLPSKDQGFNVSSECISCGVCEKLCIAQNIQIKDGKPTFQHHCTQCMSCIAYCPKGAINYKNRTQKRTKYHHPSISAKDVTFDELWFE